MNTDTEKSDNKLIVAKPTKFLGVRHLQYILLLAAMVLGYGMRTVLNVGVIAMISDDPPNDKVPTYPEWASGAMFISSVFVVLIPYFGAQFGYGGVIACRIIQGMTQGFLFPCNHNLLSSWTPIIDRAKVGGFVYAGAPLGNVVAMPITGMIAASSVGWPVAFYLYGSLGILWSLVWIWLGSDSPSTHKIPTPWKSIITSLPFLAILVAHSGQNWGFWTLLTEIPSFMEEILGFKIASNSYLSALPYFVQWIMGLAMSPIADLLIMRNVLSTGSSRKLFNSIGLFIPAVALISLTFVSAGQKIITIVMLVIAVGFNAGVYVGYTVNHIDISPVHAGTLMGITNSLANIFSILAPLAVDAIKAISGYEETDKSLWNIVFFVAAGIYLLTGTFYIFTASGIVQPWDNLEHSKKSEREVKPTCLNS
ncbi:hypothetical protein NQ314_017446 [Rhamnusium bicolor]|uniref:Major facilitator superfamily (MFS) profile domain-containing protein n=1 Tax=Rhamnusium bicolor TaxID=1586634 RepID=A0AAV8WUE3_9CUCU|nr:hypothetical protein NQ314_017446 [Rhamnusium bicolor]